jgi:MoaA/NifB/PqqE/SkfB family radical SAM enzyme
MVINLDGGIIYENDKVKFLVSEPIKSFFNKRTGYTATWGRTKEDDPDMCQYGPLIADIEISTACSQNCPMCYKGNRAEGRDMTLAQFQTILAKMPKTIQQIAFGLGDTPNLDGTRGNPDCLAIFDYCRSQGVIPNATVNGFGLDKATAERLAGALGACAVSRYNPKDVCYDAVKMLTDAGMTQCNIHMLCAESSLSDCMELLDDAKTDSRLAKLNAIVFLSGKQKGRGTWLKPVSPEKYKELILAAFEKGVRIGFDSCSCHKFLKAVEGMPQAPMLRTFSEPCESGLFSAYIGVDGTYYPCSFADEKVKGINLFEVDSFMDIWRSPQVEGWRKRLLANERRCPLYAI